MTLISQLMAVADAYCLATGRSRARVSTLVLNRGAKLDDIASGKDLTTGSFERAMAWFSSQWPAGAAWPEGVDRPSIPSAGPIDPAQASGGGAPAAEGDGVSSLAPNAAGATIREETTA